MKKIFKSCTFYFAIIGIAVVTFNLLGYDYINVIMIGINPILNILAGSTKFCDLMRANHYLWHILSFATITLYGYLIDLIIKKVKENKSKSADDNSQYTKKTT